MKRKFIALLLALVATGTVALIANDLTATAIAFAIYDGTEFQLLNPQTGSSNTPNPLTTLSSPGTRKIQVDQAPKGPNPHIDIRNYGARPVVPSVVPSIPGITANCTSGSPNVTISSASTFQNGDGVALYGCGPTNANTPAAPTIRPVVMASQTGTLAGVTAPVGSTTYCYQLLSRTFMGGTAPGPEACTTTGPASLGMQQMAITSVSLSNNVATFTTSAPHGLVAGALVVTWGVSTSELTPAGQSDFNCWCRVATVPDNTHFTVNMLIDTRNGAVASATGGNVVYWNAIEVAASETTNNYQYYIYGRVAGGTKTLLGTMLPQNHAQLGSDPFYLLWDDFGTIPSTFPLPPPYIPTTVPTDFHQRHAGNNHRVRRGDDQPHFGSERRQQQLGPRDPVR